MFKNPLSTTPEIDELLSMKDFESPEAKIKYRKIAKRLILKKMTQGALIGIGVGVVYHLLGQAIQVELTEEDLKEDEETSIN